MARSSCASSGSLPSGLDVSLSLAAPIRAGQILTTLLTQILVTPEVFFLPSSSLYYIHIHSTHGVARIA